MAAATDNRPGDVRSIRKIRRYLMAASTTIYANTLVMVNSAGLAVPAVASASNKGCVGFAVFKQVSAASGSYYVFVAEGEILLNATSIAQANTNSLVYASDDNTIDETQGANEPIAGQLIQYVSATQGWVDVGPQYFT